MAGCHPSQPSKCELHGKELENFCGFWKCPECNWNQRMVASEQPVSPMVEQMQRLEKEIEILKIRLTEHEDWTRKDEDSIYERLKKIDGRDKVQIEINRKVSDAINDLRERVSSLEEQFKLQDEYNCVMSETYSSHQTRIENLESHKTMQIDENRKISRRVDELDKWVADHQKEGEEYGDIIEERIKDLEESYQGLFHEVKVGRKPHRCPICKGTTFCEAGMCCAPCDGAGIVWG